jgi:ubiquinone/menaquinone biosynthesis C-methylase UbiE
VIILNDKNNILTHSNKGYENCAEYYDLFASNDDLPFYLEYAKIQKGPILDLACGTGRVTIPLAEAGYSVIGLESSPSMLQVARRKVSKLSEDVKSRINLIHSNMISFKINQKFNLIIIPTSFGHCLTKEQQQSCLSCINKHLTNKGKFVLDLYLGESLNKSGSFKDEPIKIDNKRMVRRSGTYETDFKKQISYYKLKFQIFDKNELIDEIFEESIVAVIFSSEINQLLKETGFKIVNEYSDWNKTIYDPNKEHDKRILILEKID